jgi:GR25 family glycosyltransferase involved in LPS biosynthesis
MKVYYINLDHRTDRKEHIENELKKQGITKFERVQAVYIPQFGALGCTESHIKTLEKFSSEIEDDEYCMVLEDDFYFTRSFSDFNFPDFEWDVIMLSGRVLKTIDTENSHFKKVIDAQTTSGYIVHKKFVPTLLKNLKNGRELFLKFRIPEKYAIDMYWKSLQKESKWFVCEPKFGVQTPNYSDIEGSFVYYGV